MKKLFSLFIKEIALTLKMSGPITLSFLGFMLMGVIDNVMVGNLGTLPLAAAAFANSLFAFFFLFGIGVANGISPLVAVSLGKNDTSLCRDYLKASVWMHTLGSIFLIGCIYLCLFNLSYFGQPPEVIPLTKGFIQILSWSLLPAMIFQVYRQFYQGLSKTIMPMVLTFIGVAVNTFINYLLIWGNWGFPKMGLNGAAWGTLLARLFMAVSIIALVHSHKPISHLLPTQWFTKVRKDAWTELIRLGLPSGFAVFFEVGAFSGAAFMMGWLGSIPLAAHQIALNVASITFMIPLGIGSATSVRLGYAFGQRDFKQIKLITISSFVTGLLFMSLLGLLMIVFAQQIPSLYIPDISVQKLTAELLVIAALFQIFDGTQVIQSGGLRGLTDIKWPFIITLTAYWLISLPIGYILGFKYHLGAAGIWWGLFVGLFIAAILLTLRIRHLLKHLQSIFSPSEKQPKSF